MRRQDAIEIKQEAASWVNYKLFFVTRVRKKRESVNTQSRNSYFSPKTKWDDGSSGSFLRIQVKGYLQAPSYFSSLPAKQNKKRKRKKNSLVLCQMKQRIQRQAHHQQQLSRWQFIKQLKKPKWFRQLFQFHTYEIEELCFTEALWEFTDVISITEVILRSFLKGLWKSRGIWDSKTFENPICFRGGWPSKGLGKLPLRVVSFLLWYLVKMSIESC